MVVCMGLTDLGYDDTDVPSLIPDWECVECGEYLAASDGAVVRTMDG